MPIYDFACNDCDHKFEESFPMSKSDGACAEPCPKCGKNSVYKVYSTGACAVDYNMRPGQDFNELMDKMKRGVPERFREKLDKSKETRGGNLGKIS